MSKKYLFGGQKPYITSATEPPFSLNGITDMRSGGNLLRPFENVEIWNFYFIYCTCPDYHTALKVKSQPQTQKQNWTIMKNENWHKISIFLFLFPFECRISFQYQLQIFGSKTDFWAQPYLFHVECSVSWF